MAKDSVKKNGNVNVPVATNGGEDKKRQASKSLYINSEGEKTRSPTANTVGMEFQFTGVPDSLVCMFDDLPEEIRNVYCVAQGANIKVQRSFNTAKGNAAQMREEAADTWQNLVDGIWTSDREGGLRIGDLADAIAATIVDEGGTVDEVRLASIKEKLKDETSRDKAKDSPKVKAHLTRIAAEKAAKRASEAADTAKTAALADMEAQGF